MYRRTNKFEIDGRVHQSENDLLWCQRLISKELQNRPIMFSFRHFLAATHKAGLSLLVLFSPKLATEQLFNLKFDQLWFSWYKRELRSVSANLLLHSLQDSKLHASYFIIWKNQCYLSTPVLGRGVHLIWIIFQNF